MDFGPGVPERAAGLARDQVGEAFLVRADIIGEAAHGLDAIDQRQRGPRLCGTRDAGDLVRNFAGLALPKQGAGRWLIGTEHR